MEIKQADNYKQIPDNIKKSLADANVFFSPNYENYIKRINQKEVYLYNTSFVIPVIIYKKYMFEYAAFPSEPLHISKDSDQELGEFLQQSMNYLRSHSNIIWVITNAAALFMTYPEKSLRIPFGSHIIDLSLDEATIWSNIHSKHKNSIRRAEKSNIIIKNGGKELLEDYAYIDKETWARSSRKALGKTFFENMVDELKENIIVFIAYKNEKPQAGAIFYYSCPMSYYMYGASINHPDPGATNLLHWEAIKYMKTKQVKEYSFVGCRINEDENSKYHSIQRFKSRFGGELRQGYMFKVILDKQKYKLFKSMYKWKNHEELSDAVDEEVSKWHKLNE